jgi:hypothetical protein
MEDMIVGAVGTLLDTSADLEDKDGLIATCIVKAINAFSNINKLALLHRRKKYTDAKLEDVGRELSKILFYNACLSHLVDITPDFFSVEALTQFSQSFPDDYQHDVIMCSLHGIQNLIDISEDIFSSIPLEDPPPEEINEEHILSTKSESEEEDESDVIQEGLATVFGCVICLCSRLELDLESIMFNTSTIEKL